MISLKAAWARELLLALAAFVWLLILGIWLDSLALFLLPPVLAYLGWHLIQLYRLGRWLERSKYSHPPRPIGLWADILLDIEVLRERGKRRKRKLGRMLSGFQESTSALPDATVVLDDQGEMEWWNGVAREMLGLDRKTDKGALIQSRINDPVFRDYLEQGDYRHPLQIPAPVDESIALEIRVVPYGKGKRLLQARDITRLNQLETVRRDFVANVSHEMRTPLTVLHGYLETLADNPDEAMAPWQGIFGQMYQQTSRMQRIVEDLLLLARFDSSEQVQDQLAVDVPAMLEQVREEARVLSGEQTHEIELHAEPELFLMGHPGELHSAFSNLVSNAVRYTPSGGRITISWSTSPNGACFSVRDTGIGIALEHIPRLTERFYRVDVGRSRQSGGTGLGLAIVKHVLTRHNGRLQVKSEPGRGSEFRCLFPLSQLVE